MKMSNLREIRARIEYHLQKHKSLKWRKQNIIDQIVFEEEILKELRDRESELERETFNDNPDPE